MALLSSPATWLNDDWLMGVPDVTMVVKGIDQMGSLLELKEFRSSGARSESLIPAPISLRVAFFKR